MATATMATAAGAAALLYYALRRHNLDDSEAVQEGALVDSSKSTVRLGLERHAPSTWFEAIATLSEALRFTYSETLGKWPIVDLAFGINFLMKRQGQSQVVNAYAGVGNQELRGQNVIVELKELLILVNACIHFSRKPFQQFLEASGYSSDSVLLQEPKAGLLKPAFAILLDVNLQSILLLIRGTHSVKDTLTAVTGAVVPFHYTVLGNGGVSNIVVGYAHCGMVAAARWIAQLATPTLLQAQQDHPTYKLKIVGHSLGGGTAALLTYILRERKEFSTVSCICFGPAACMTWELAESGKPFITSVVHGSDIVPTFSAASVDDLRKEVTASAWVNDFRQQIERVKFLKVVLSSTSALRNRISSIAARSSKPLYPYLEDAARASASALRPVSNGTQVVMRQAQNVVQAVKTRSSLASWPWTGARRHTAVSRASLDSGPGSASVVAGVCESSAEMQEEGTHEQDSGGSSEDDDELRIAQKIDGREKLTDEVLLQHLEQELGQQRRASMSERQEEEEIARKLTQEEEESVAATAAKAGGNCVVKESGAQGRELNRFFPPGRIIHLLAFDPDKLGREEEETATAPSTSQQETADSSLSHVGLYLTNRALYGKVRLSRTMVSDHYMPSYKRTVEALVQVLESDL